MKLLVVPFGSLETYVIIVQRTVDGYRGSHVSHTVPCPRESRGDERERTSDANRTSRRLTVDGPSMGQVKERTERGSTKARDEQTRSRTRQLRVHAYRELLFGNVRARVPSTSRRSIDRVPRWYPPGRGEGGTWRPPSSNKMEFSRAFNSAYRGPPTSFPAGSPLHTQTLLSTTCYQSVLIDLPSAMLPRH